MSPAQAGKALHSKRAEIRVQFRHVPGNLYRNKMGADLDSATNELVRSCSCLLSMLRVHRTAAARLHARHLFVCVSEHRHSCAAWRRAVAADCHKSCPSLLHGVSQNSFRCSRRW